MLFNSIEFLLFLPVVLILYWFVTNKNLTVQNALLLFSSYFFYSCWSRKFLLLLIFSTLLDYFTGLMMYQAKNQVSKRFWFWLSISVNLGFLGVFKYYNFFQSSLAEALGHAGIKTNFYTLSIILPVGISFYTFHGLSYVIDIYNNKIKPCKNFIEYSVFVSFFPLLVAGPIERATHLLPQIQKERKFDYTKAVDGLRQILWGLFKKMVIADNCAQYANLIFKDTLPYSGSTNILGAVFFALQIYCDFSGYSDIALGTAKLFGIDLLRNFAFPYFSRDIAEFWRRWHISLSSWFRDYLYFPLGGSRGGKWKNVRNTFIIFLVSGFWHGANWTFICWGALNAIYFLPLLLLKRNRDNIDIVAKGRLLPSAGDALKIATTFSLTILAWIFFRSSSVSMAVAYIGKIFTKALFYPPAIQPAAILLAFILLFILIEWVGREEQFATARLGFKWPRPLRWAFYLGIGLSIFFYSGFEQQFIYFQF